MLGKIKKKFNEFKGKKEEVVEEKEKEEVDNEIHIVMVGDAGTGKTSLISSFVDSTFDPVYKPSVVDTFETEVEISHPSYSHIFPVIKLCIRDMSGKHDLEHATMRSHNYKDADIIVLCYSLSDRGKSLDNVKSYWIE